MDKPDSLILGALSEVCAKMAALVLLIKNKGEPPSSFELAMTFEDFREIVLADANMETWDRCTELFVNHAKACIDKLE